MGKEIFSTKKEQPITTVEDLIALLIREIPKYTTDMLDKPQGGDNTTLREFLTNKTDGSEWTDLLGFKVKIEKNKYILEQ